MQLSTRVQLHLPSASESPAQLPEIHLYLTSVIFQASRSKPRNIRLHVWLGFARTRSLTLPRTGSSPFLALALRFLTRFSVTGTTAWPYCMALLPPGICRLGRQSDDDVPSYTPANGYPMTDH